MARSAYSRGKSAQGLSNSNWARGAASGGSGLFWIAFVVGMLFLSPLLTIAALAVMALPLYALYWCVKKYTTYRILKAVKEMNK